VRFGFALALAVAALAGGAGAALHVCLQVRVERVPACLGMAAFVDVLTVTEQRALGLLALGFAAALDASRALGVVLALTVDLAIDMCLRVALGLAACLALGLAIDRSRRGRTAAVALGVELGLARSDTLRVAVTRFAAAVAVGVTLRVAVALAVEIRIDGAFGDAIGDAALRGAVDVHAGVALRRRALDLRLRRALGLHGDRRALGRAATLHLDLAHCARFDVDLSAIGEARPCRARNEHRGRASKGETEN